MIFVYEVYCGEAPNFNLLYEDTSVAPTLALIDPVLTLEEGKAGSFTCTIPVTHPLWASVKRRVTEVRVYRRGKLLWYGQVLDEDQDFYKQKKIVAEGPWAFLNNTMQNNHEYTISTDNDIKNYAKDVIDHHNYAVDNTIDQNGNVVNLQTIKSSRRKLYFSPSNCYVGIESCIRQIVPNLQPNKLETSVDKSTKDSLDDLTSTYGGYFEVRYYDENGNPYTDGTYHEPIGQLYYLPDYIDSEGHEVNRRPTSSQVIIFAQTLINFTQTWTTGDICTVIRPLGANDDDGNPITIPKGYIVVSQELLDRYGWIERTVKWPDIDNATVLENLAKRYATNLQFTNGSIDGSKDLGTFSLTITALDASYLNVDIDAFNLGENVRVYSEYHGVDQYYPVQRMEIHMDRPESTVISLNKTTSDRDLSTSLSNMEDKVSKIDDSDVSSELEDLSNELDKLKEWAETEGLLDDVGYFDGGIDLDWWIASKMITLAVAPAIALINPYGDGLWIIGYLGPHSINGIIFGRIHGNMWTVNSSIELL